MTVLDRATMKDGTEIQLEDWRDHNTKEYPDLFGLEIAAFPIAQRTGKYRFVEGGRKFRLSIATNNYAGYTTDDVRADYEALKSGKKKLEDLSEHFWYGKKDMWYLGMDVECKGY